jgi:alpha-glucosidase/alpha-D-xyloside xylohydrolase
VLEPGATRRKTYLPAGAWWNFWSNQKVQGGTEIASEVDLSTIPLYVRAGVIVPMGPARQYAMEPSEEPVTLRVYPGADGRSNWYEDDGIGFAYRKGQFTRFDCIWQDSTRRLILELAAGSMPSSQRKIRIRMMDTGTIKTISTANRVTVVEI